MNELKKIGIITLVGDNYGNKYQNYAVEWLFSQYGHVTTFALEDLFQPPEAAQIPLILKIQPSYIRRVIQSRLSYQYDLNSTFRGIISNLLYAKKHREELRDLQKQRHERFVEFSNQYLHINE